MFVPIVVSGCERLTPASDSETERLRTIAQMSTAPFACGIEFTTVSTISDESMANYDMPPLVDTARVCGTWTGSDYKMHVEQLGASDAQSDAPDSLRVVMIDGGVASGSDATGAPVAAPSSVASNGFDLGQATPNEEQASYSEPYYGLTSGGGGGGGSTCIENCEPMTNVASNPNASPRAHLAKTKEHGIRKGGLRALLGDKDEIDRANNGHRRFRLVQGDVEEVIEVDPTTELISAQESKSRNHHTRATLTWKKQKSGRWVREFMEVDHTELVDGRQLKSRATVRVLNLRLGGQP